MMAKKRLCLGWTRLFLVLPSGKKYKKKRKVNVRKNDKISSGEEIKA